VVDAVDVSLVVPFLALSFGCLLAFVIVGRRQPDIIDRLVDTLAWGPGLAAGVLSLGSFFALALGIGRLWFGAFLAITLVLAAWAALASHRPRPAVSRPEPSADLPLRRGVAIGWVASGALLAGYGWSFSRWVEYRPLGSYDAMGIWTYRALQWFRSAEAFPETIGMLLDSKPGYPLLVPGLIASQFSMWGSEATAIPVATGWFFTIGLGAVTYLAVARWASPGAALASVVLLFSTPMIWRWAFAQSADLPLAYLTLTAAVGLTGLVFREEHRPVSPWLTGFFLGLMVWTKNEGMVLSLILVVVFAGRAWILRGRLRKREWSLVALGSLPGVLATVGFKHAWVATPEIDRYLGPGLFSRLADPARWRDVAAAFADRLTPASGEALWGGTWLALAGLLAIAVVRRGSARYRRVAQLYAIAFGCIFGFDFVVYLITPEPLGWHLQTSLDRLLLQIVPLITVAAFIAFFGDPVAQGENESKRNLVHACQPKRKARGRVRSNPEPPRKSLRVPRARWFPGSAD